MGCQLAAHASTYGQGCLFTSRVPLEVDRISSCVCVRRAILIVSARQNELSLMHQRF